MAEEGETAQNLKSNEWASMWGRIKQICPSPLVQPWKCWIKSKSWTQLRPIFFSLIKSVFLELCPTWVLLSFLSPTFGSKTFHHLSHFTATSSEETQVGLCKWNRRVRASAAVASFPLGDPGRALSPEVAYQGGQFIAINFSATPNWARFNPITKDESV